VIQFPLLKTDAGELSGQGKDDECSSQPRHVVARVCGTDERHEQRLSVALDRSNGVRISPLTSSNSMSSCARRRSGRSS
jgi:hypothetical protein